MKITKRQLRQLIRESFAQEGFEFGRERRQNSRYWQEGWDDTMGEVIAGPRYAIDDQSLTDEEYSDYMDGYEEGTKFRHDTLRPGEELHYDEYI